MCDPAAYVKGTNEVTGFSIEFNLANGEKIEQSEYEVSKFDRTGWRGTDCGRRTLRSSVLLTISSTTQT